MTSQCFITLDTASQCNRKHVVFGSVVSGMEVVRYVEGYATLFGTEPSVPVRITDCGAFNPLPTPGGGAGMTDRMWIPIRVVHLNLSLGHELAYQHPLCKWQNVSKLH